MLNGSLKEKNGPKSVLFVFLFFRIQWSINKQKMLLAFNGSKTTTPSFECRRFVFFFDR